MFVRFVWNLQMFSLRGCACHAGLYPDVNDDVSYDLRPKAKPETHKQVLSALANRIVVGLRLCLTVLSTLVRFNTAEPHYGNQTPALAHSP